MGIGDDVNSRKKAHRKMKLRLEAGKNTLEK